MRRRSRVVMAMVVAGACSLVSAACTNNNKNSNGTSPGTSTIGATASGRRSAINADTVAPSIITGLRDNDVPLAITKCPATGKPVKELATAKAARGSGVPDGTFTIAEDRASHVEDCVDYDARPPVGGDHFAIWVNCGLYYDRVPDMMAVHVMEHGAVWIAYRPDVTTADLDAIAVAVAATTHLLASPSPDLPSPLVLSAWGAQLQLDSAGDPRFAAFLSHYIQGPQTRELGASCSGAIGTPNVAALGQ